MPRANICVHKSNERPNIQSKYREKAQLSYASLMANTCIGMALT